MIASAELSKVQGYIDAVLAGDIVTGKLVRAAVQRHVDDLAIQSTKEFPYHFDANAAECGIHYFPTCLKHSIGDYAGQPFEQEPWQGFGVANILGWKRDVDLTRRFRRVYWSTARKNGKSTEGGGLATQLAHADINPNTGEPEQVADVILCATKREQVEKVMFAEIKRMRLQSAEIKASSSVVNNVFTFQENLGTIRCIGSDRPYSGLNPSVVIKDEVHEFQEFHRKFLQTMDTGGGSRCQPLDIIFTTAGDTKALIWCELYRYFRRVVLGEIKDESCFCYCFEIDEKDDPLDEEVWQKANPNIGQSLKLDYLRDQAKRALGSAIELNQFTRFHANRMVSSTAAAFDMEKWDACEGELSDWDTSDAIGAGVDIGGRDDLAALGFVAKFRIEREEPELETDEERDDWLIEQEKNPLYRYEIRAQAYIAVDTARDLTVAPFADWVHTDLIKRCELPLVQLIDDLIQETNRLYVSSVAYDPAGGQLFAEQVSQNTGVEVASMAQNYTHFHEPIQDFRQAMADGRLRHDGNPVLKWCLGNAVSIKDPQDREMFCKRDSSEKIDLAVGVLMAYRRAMLAPARGQGALYIT